MPIAAVFSRHAEALEWARKQAEANWGKLLAVSKPFAFTQTDYYYETMGTGLQKQLLAFEQLMSPGALPAYKLQANDWEQQYLANSTHEEARPLNIDPGYLALGNFILASTKNHLHRVYMADGIYAEVTLHFRHGAWEPWPWTYPDYRLPEVHAFLTECRSKLHRRLREEGSE